MDLTTNYMGLALKNPLVASASTLTGDVGTLVLLEESGAAAVVLPSLYQEEIEADAARYHHLAHANDNSWPEATTSFPRLADPHHRPHEYLDLIRRSKEAVGIPVIASLNGITHDGWIDHARLIEEAGADALELNVYFIATDLAQNGETVERRYLDILRAVRAAVNIPVAIKLGPYFSAVGHLALALQEAGADAFVLFNRFYQPDIDILGLRLLTDLQLSHADEIRLPLLWIAVLAGRMKASLAASSGVGGPDEVVKYLLAGADVVMTTSALLRHGPRHMATLLAGLEAWLSAREFATVAEARGLMSQARLKHPQALERANYMKILQGYRRA
jgi:dihydroorotate dehydrogenase (fumarate)